MSHLSFSFALNIALMLGWHSVQQKMIVHTPPQIPITSLILKANEISPATIYSFAYYIWQSINYWPQNDMQDYKKTIEQFAPYLTPCFKAFLQRDYLERINQGEIQDRQRTLQGANCTAFEISHVEYIGHDTWLVHLAMRLSEHMNINGNQVKETAIDYTLRVVRYDVNATANAWGLALDGFVNNPERVQTYINQTLTLNYRL